MIDFERGHRFSSQQGRMASVINQVRIFARSEAPATQPERPSLAATAASASPGPDYSAATLLIAA
jgi:hypothetical protein